MLRPVAISKRHSRFFAHEDGTPFIPVGLNVCFPRMVTGEAETLGKMEEWFGKISAHGGNFIRLWLSHPAFAVERERCGVFEEAYTRRLDRVFAMAESHGIYVQVCLEHFRSLSPKPDLFPGAANFGNPVPHVNHGGAAETMDDFWQKPACRDLFVRKVHYLADRFGHLPHVFLWELWNEVNAAEGKGWEDWTRHMLTTLKRSVPQRLVTQSLGSWCQHSDQGVYQRLFHMPENEVAQVHRYLDEGGDPSMSGGPLDVLSAKAMEDAFGTGARGPMLLAEGGAVESHHAGPWRFYPEDRDGIVFHDVLFAPFFAGGAGTGMMWHWDFYVDKQNLWHHLSRFRQAIAGFDPIAELAVPFRSAQGGLRLHVLMGLRTTLVWIRDGANDWKAEFVRKTEIDPVNGVALDLSPLRIPDGERRITCLDPWNGDGFKPLRSGPENVDLPRFKRSLILRIDHETRNPRTPTQETP